MKNPNYVQGFVKGSQHYQYQENWSGTVAGENATQATDGGVTSFGGKKAGVPELRNTIGGMTTHNTTLDVTSPWAQRSIADGNMTMMSPGNSLMMQTSISYRDKQRSASVIGAMLTGPLKKNLKQTYNIQVHNLSKLKTDATAVGMPMSENNLLAEAI